MLMDGMGDLVFEKSTFDLFWNLILLLSFFHWYKWIFIDIRMIWSYWPGTSAGSRFCYIILHQSCSFYILIALEHNFLFNFQVRVVRRDNGVKMDIPMHSLVEQVKEILFNIQESLFNAAKQKRDVCIKVINTWDQFIAALNDKKLILAPWCDEEVWYILIMKIV